MNNVELVKSSVITNLRDYLFYLFPNGVIKNNNFYIGDLQGSAGSSLVIALEGEKAGLWKDFATDEGGDVFHLWQYVKGSKENFSEVVQDISNWLCLPQAPQKAQIVKLKKAPRIVKIHELKADKIYDYFDSHGRLVIKILRIEPKKEGENKRFCPYVYLPKTNEFVEGLDRAVLSTEHGLTLRPLYNTENKKSTHTKVLLVEGEKCVDAVQAKYGDLIWVTTWIGGGGALKHSDFSELKEFEKIYFWQDADKTGDTAFEQFKIVCQQQVHVVNIDRFEKAYDVYDWMQDNPEKSVIEFIENNSLFNQKLNLAYTSEHKLKLTLTNLTEIFTKHPEFYGKISYNQLRGRYAIRKSCPFGEPGLWNTINNHKARIWLETNYNLNGNLGPAIVDAAFEAAADNYPFNPVTDLLDTLTWDGSDVFFGDWLKSENNDYTYATIKYWMMGAVKRAYEPGCKWREVLILSGEQGIGKSTFFEVLALNKDWFSDSKLKIGDGEGYGALRGKWIVEFGELSSFNKKDQEDIKNFIAASVDVHRTKYEKYEKDLLRRCVFGGTSNNEKYLTDPTGGTRYLPVTLTYIDWDFLNENVKKMWAQVVHDYKKGVIYTHHELTKSEQDNRFDADVWYDDVKNWLGTRDRTTAAEILYEALNIRLGDQSRPLQKRVAAILRHLGFRQKTVRTGGGAKDTKNMWVKE